MWEYVRLEDVRDLSMYFWFICLEELHILLAWLLLCISKVDSTQICQHLSLQPHLYTFRANALSMKLKK